MSHSFLVGSSVYLRPIEETDLSVAYRDWFNDPEVCAWNSHHRFPNYDEDMRAYYESTIRSHNNLILAICDKKTDRHIGNASLQGIDHLDRSAEFAILIGEKAFWGKGVGKEVATLIITHGFHQLNLHRIYCGTAENNMGMQQLAISIGFVEEGRSRQALFKDGGFRDIIHYGILEDEFQGRVG